MSRRLRLAGVSESSMNEAGLKKRLNRLGVTVGGRFCLMLPLLEGTVRGEEGGAMLVFCEEG